MNARLPLSASLRLLLACLLLAGAVASAPAEVRTVTDPAAPRALPADGPVSVDWTDPAKFSEIRYSGNRWEAERGDWVVQLARYLRQRAAARLPAGQTLDVTLTDIRRAGNYESWHGPRGNDVRIVRDLYPPRIELHFVLHGAESPLLTPAILQEMGRRGPPLQAVTLANVGHAPALMADEQVAIIAGWLRL